MYLSICIWLSASISMRSASMWKLSPQNGIKAIFSATSVVSAWGLMEVFKMDVHCVVSESFCLKDCRISDFCSLLQKICNTCWYIMMTKPYWGRGRWWHLKWVHPSLSTHWPSQDIPPGGHLVDHTWRKKLWQKRSKYVLINRLKERSELYKEDPRFQAKNRY